MGSRQGAWRWGWVVAVPRLTWQDGPRYPGGQVHCSTSGAGSWPVTSGTATSMLMSETLHDEMHDNTRSTLVHAQSVPDTLCVLPMALSQCCGVPSGWGHHSSHMGWGKGFTPESFSSDRTG